MTAPAAAQAATTARTETERRLGRPLPDLTTAGRTDLLSVMTSDETSQLLAWLGAWAPEMFDAALAARSRDFADDLAARLSAQRAADDEEDGGYSIAGEGAR